SCGGHPHQWSQLPHERSQRRIFRWGSKMKGGSILGWRTVVGVVGSTSPGAALRPSASVGFWESRAEWPCSVGIRSERVEAGGVKIIRAQDYAGVDTITPRSSGSRTGNPV